MNKIYQVNANTEIVEAVKELPDGSILFAGYSMPPGSGSTPGFLAKTDSMGNLQWWHFYSNGRIIIHSLDVLQDGSVMMCGEGGNFQMILLKADTGGNFKWAKVYGASGPDGFFDMRTLADGNMLLSGASYIASFPNIGYDMALIKCDTAGTILWTNNFGGNYNDQCYGLIVCSDGGFALCGQTDNNSSSLILPGIAHIVKTDHAGFSGCNETIRSYTTTNLALNNSAVAVTSFSNFSSSLINFASNNAGTDSLLCLETGIKNEDHPIEKISYYPNPVEEFLNITCSAPCENSVLEIYDAFGKNVFASPMSHQLTNSFNISHLSMGIYFLKMKNGKNAVIGKIIKL